MFKLFMKILSLLYSHLIMISQLHQVDFIWETWQHFEGLLLGGNWTHTIFSVGSGTIFSCLCGHFLTVHQQSVPRCPHPARGHSFSWRALPHRVLQLWHWYYDIMTLIFTLLQYFLRIEIANWLSCFTLKDLWKHNYKWEFKWSLCT